MAEQASVQLKKIDAYRWLIPREGGMRTDGLVYADERMIGESKRTKASSR